MLIEHDVPIPVKWADSLSMTLRKLAIGDSILVTEKIASVRPLVTRIKAEFCGKRKFTTRAESGGIRVWREK